MIPRNRKEFEYSGSLSNFHPRLVALCHQNLIATFDEYTRRVKKKTTKQSFRRNLMSLTF